MMKMMMMMWLCLISCQEATADASPAAMLVAAACRGDQAAVTAMINTDRLGFLWYGTNDVTQAYVEGQLAAFMSSLQQQTALGPTGALCTARVTGMGETVQVHLDAPLAALSGTWVFAAGSDGVWQVVSMPHPPEAL